MTFAATSRLAYASMTAAQPRLIAADIVLGAALTETPIRTS